MCAVTQPGVSQRCLLGLMVLMYFLETTLLWLHICCCFCIAVSCYAVVLMVAQQIFQAYVYHRLGFDLEEEEGKHSFRPDE